MEWKSPAILLTHQDFGSKDMILEVFSKTHGRARGMVRVPNKRPLWLSQQGCLIHARWCARLSDQLGKFYIDPLSTSPGFFYSASELAALSLVLTLLRVCPEKHPYPHLFDQTCFLFQHLSPQNYIRWELILLEELGFGLDLSHCALTGVTEGLSYISPHTGRAATREAGWRWRDKLLALPAFLTNALAAASPQCIRDGLHLTGYFLLQHEIMPRNHCFWQYRRHFESEHSN